jgi:tetratricopeptide (TPR) repeat protein
MKNTITEVLNKYVDSITKLSEDDTKLYKNVVKFMNVGDYNSALKIIEDLCKRFPFNTIFLKTMASCFQKQERYEAAIMSYRTAYLLIPDANQDCLYFIGICHYKKGDFAEATTYFSDFLSKDKGNEAHKKRAALYLKKMEA